MPPLGNTLLICCDRSHSGPPWRSWGARIPPAPAFYLRRPPLSPPDSYPLQAFSGVRNHSVHLFIPLPPWVWGRWTELAWVCLMQLGPLSQVDNSSMTPFFPPDTHIRSWDNNPLKTSENWVQVRKGLSPVHIYAFV